MAEKKWDIPVVYQYPKIIILFDVADFNQDMSVIFLAFVLDLLVCFKICNFNIDRKTQWIRKQNT